MRRSLLIVLLIGVATEAFAQRYLDTLDPYAPLPGRYIHVGYLLDQQPRFADPALNAYETNPEWGVTLEAGTTYMLNRLPWGGMLRLGIDWSYLDLQYALYRHRIGGTSLDTPLASAGMRVGPSLTLTPARELNFKAYVHYAPTFTALASDDWKSIVGGYAGYGVGGASASWRVVTLGWEMRVPIDRLSLQEIRDDDGASTLPGDKQRVKLPSMRVYFGFRF